MEFWKVEDSKCVKHQNRCLFYSKILALLYVNVSLEYRSSNAGYF